MTGFNKQYFVYSVCDATCCSKGLIRSIVGGKHGSIIFKIFTISVMSVTWEIEEGWKEKGEGGSIHTGSVNEGLTNRRSAIVRSKSSLAPCYIPPILHIHIHFQVGYFSISYIMEGFKSIHRSWKTQFQARKLQKSDLRTLSTIVHLNHYFKIRVSSLVSLKTNQTYFACSNSYCLTRTLRRSHAKLLTRPRCLPTKQHGSPKPTNLSKSKKRPTPLPKLAKS